MGATPNSSWPWVKTLLHSVYDQPDQGAVHDQYDRILDALADKLPAVAEHLDLPRADVLAFSTFPKETWRQIWSNNPSERPTARSVAAPMSSDPPRPSQRHSARRRRSR